LQQRRQKKKAAADAAKTAKLAALKSFQDKAIHDATIAKDLQDEDSFGKDKAKWKAHVHSNLKALPGFKEALKAGVLDDDADKAPKKAPHVDTNWQDEADPGTKKDNIFTSAGMSDVDASDSSESLKTTDFEFGNIAEDHKWED